MQWETKNFHTAKHLKNKIRLGKYSFKKKKKKKRKRAGGEGVLP